MLDSLKSSKKAVGIKQTLKAAEAGTAKTVFIAMDAEDKVVLPIKELCQKNAIPVVNVESMKQLGKACGIDVDAAVACLLN